MNKGQNVRRGRTRHTPNKGGSNNNGTGNRVDSKSRGNPKQNLDKYLGMARDAKQAGDRVNEEYYLQFAEHFQRVMNERNQSNEDRQRSNNNRSNNNNRGRHQNKDAGQQQSQKQDNQAIDEKTSVDPSKQAQPDIVDQKSDKPEVKAETKPEVKAETKPEVKAETKPEVKAETKSEVKAEASQDNSPTEEKPKRRAPRKPRLKPKAEVTDSVASKDTASPEAPIKKEGEAAE